MPCRLIPLCSSWPSILVVYLKKFILLLDEEENTPDEINQQKSDTIRSSKPDRSKPNDGDTESLTEEESALEVKVSRRA